MEAKENVSDFRHNKRRNERKSPILGQDKWRTEQKWDLQADFLKNAFLKYYSSPLPSFALCFPRP
jgi:hypothetical protein